MSMVQAKTQVTPSTETPVPIHNFKLRKFAASISPSPPSLLTSALLIKSMSQVPTPRMMQTAKPSPRKIPVPQTSALSSRPTTQNIFSLNSTTGSNFRIASTNINLIDFVESPRTDSPRNTLRARSRRSPMNKGLKIKTPQLIRGNSLKLFKPSEMKTEIENNSETFLTVMSGPGYKRSNIMRFVMPLMGRDRLRLMRGYTGKSSNPLSATVSLKPDKTKSEVRPNLTILAQGKGYLLKPRTAEERSRF